MSVHSVSSWQKMNNWYNAIGVANQQLAALNNAAGSAFASAQSTYYQNMASLAASAALKRVQAEAAAKTATLQSLSGTVGATVNTTA